MNVGSDRLGFATRVADINASVQKLSSAFISFQKLSGASVRGRGRGRERELRPARFRNTRGGHKCKLSGALAELTFTFTQGRPPAVPGPSDLLIFIICLMFSIDVY